MLPHFVIKNLLLLILILNASCSFLSPRELEDVRFMKMNGSLDASADQIKENLQKNKTNAGGFFDVYVMPLSAPYLQARREEIVRLRGLSESEEAQLKTQESELYLERKNCFQLALQIVRHREAISLQDWEAQVLDHQGRLYELDWTHFGPVIEGRYQTTHGQVPQWSLSAQLCSRDEIAWEKGFELVLAPNFTPWPFPKSMSFQWVFEGEREERKKKRKTYKRYRGY